MNLAEIKIAGKSVGVTYVVSLKKDKVADFLLLCDRFHVMTEDDFLISSYSQVPDSFDEAGFGKDDKPVGQAEIVVWDKARRKAYAKKCYNEAVSAADALDEALVSVDNYSKVVVDISDFISRYPSLTWEFVREIRVNSKSFDLPVSVGHMLARIDEFEERFAESNKLLNKKLNVHITGNQMLMYNEVMLLEDCCTNSLSAELRNGWRIICACPQEARRPDYIMGRFNPNLEFKE